MKRLFVISTLVFALISCTKEINLRITPPPPPPIDTTHVDSTNDTLFSAELALLKSFLIKENKYIISDFWNDYQNLYELMPERAKDDWHNWDTATMIGTLTGNALQDPYDTFDVRTLDFQVFKDSNGVYLNWIDPDYHPTILKLSDWKRECYFIMSYEAFGVNYFIKYSKLL